MTRLFRHLLYWLARLAGLTGLFAGGKSLAKYAVASFKDPYFDSFSYNDLVFSGGVIFLLSLLVLIFAEVAGHLERAACSAPAKPADKPGTPDVKPAPPTPADVRPVPEKSPESPDAKLARLVKPSEE
jgi:hypothetical protein